MPTVSFINVSKSFDGVSALDRVTFDVDDGEYLCVLGPTGSGKTTLLRLIAGLLKPSTGTISFDGEPVNGMISQNRNAAYVPQQYALFPHLTVLENVAFGPLARGRTESEALSMAMKSLELVRLAGRRTAFPKELSGGMQQRVALARGLASEARLLLLDEPLGALDARLRLDLRHKLRQIVKETGLTAIHVTHDRDEAMSVADRIMILRQGRIQDYGTPKRVYDRPSGIFVANLVGGAAFLEGVAEATSGDSSTVRLRGGVIVKTPSHLLTTNEPVIIGVRKERTRLADYNAENLIEGEIRETRFLGNSREYVVRLDNGDTMYSRQFQEGKNERFRIGDKVTVGFDRSDVLIFAYPPQGLGRELEIV